MRNSVHMCNKYNLVDIKFSEKNMYSSSFIKNFKMSENQSKGQAMSVAESKQNQKR